MFVIKVRQTRDQRKSGVNRQIPKKIMRLGDDRPKRYD